MWPFVMPSPGGREAAGRQFWIDEAHTYHPPTSTTTRTGRRPPALSRLHPQSTRACLPLCMLPLEQATPGTPRSTEPSAASGARHAKSSSAMSAAPRCHCQSALTSSTTSSTPSYVPRVGGRTVWARGTFRYRALQLTVFSYSIADVEHSTW